MTEFNDASFRSKLKRVSVGVLVIILVSASAAAIVIFASPSSVRILTAM
jgi:hypothetical protein